MLQIESAPDWGNSFWGSETLTWLQKLMAQTPPPMAKSE